MTGSAIAALATLGAAIVGLVTYVLKQRNSPQSQYKAACEAYGDALDDETTLRKQMQAELDKGCPDRALVADLEQRLRAARTRVHEAREARDRLRP